MATPPTLRSWAALLFPTRAGTGPKREGFTFLEDRSRMGKDVTAGGDGEAAVRERGCEGQGEERRGMVEPPGELAGKPGTEARVSRDLPYSPDPLLQHLDFPSPGSCL